MSGQIVSYYNKNRGWASWEVFLSVFFYKLLRLSSTWFNGRLTEFETDKVSRILSKLKEEKLVKYVKKP